MFLCDRNLVLLEIIEPSKQPIDPDIIIPQGIAFRLAGGTARSFELALNGY